MTGDLNLMMELRNRRIMKDANVVCAEDVSQKAEMGWFDTEFNMYGCTYLNPADNKLYYRVSSNAEDIYNFIESSVLEDIYPSNVMQLTEKRPVPSGMKEVIAQELKRKLAVQLQAAYPKAFFEQLYHLAEQYSEDSAAPLLWGETETLAGLFDSEKLAYFVQQVQYAYRCRTIQKDTYQQLMDWVKEEQRNMEDDLISKDIFEKTMYGIAYEEIDRIRYIENAQSAPVYEKLYSLEQQGVFVTPVFRKTFWYNYEYRLMDGIRDYKALLRNTLDTAYRAKIKAIKHRTGAVPTEFFQEAVEQTKLSMNRVCAATLIQYGHRWGIL